MLRFRSLGSGSSGNATVVEASDGLRVRRLLVDCGFGIRQLATRLGTAGLRIDEIDAIFITHEHSDHIGCVQAVALRHRIPVWMSAGTYAAMGSPDLDGLLHEAHDMAAIDLGALSLRPFTVPHDAREPLQLHCSDGAHHLGILTDLGHASNHVLEQLQGCHALLLEANHDPELLAASGYPAFLKRRIGGGHGHLANHAAAGILQAVRHAGLNRVVAAHLSAQNNEPLLAQAALAEALGWPVQAVDVASASLGTDWITVTATH
ncbi:beta-lactamase domain protein [Acidovorax delafieldii 2AN]|uniref:Beta-lactamase domain protein n=1 Tax=Acidovorax delafieldii 2AN TaxID=573060 RepID=C5T3W6_ACIDE|nr:MBL fold metallo-hydrolase [Acidovorax delafieldii]EER60836.1 beta-lactamase domain protein [Acidovorax delafieldii 2AN]